MSGLLTEAGAATAGAPDAAPPADDAGAQSRRSLGVKASQWRSWLAQFRAGYLATLLLTSVSLTIVGAALTVAMYIGAPAAPSPGERWADLVLGSAGAVALWLLVAGCAIPFATARRANAASFGDFALELGALELHLAAAPDGDAKRAAESLCRHLRSETREDRRELRWLSGTGYVEAWATLHRAQEALLAVEPAPAVVERAFQYARRLQDSNIANADKLLALLRQAADALDPAAAAYLACLAGAPGSAPTQTNGGRAGAAAQDGDEADAAAGARQGSADPSLARGAIRQVVRDVNEFRDKRRAGIVRVRNQLLRTVAFAGLLIYVLTALAVIVGVRPTALTAASAFYLVGATVGLFNRLYLDSQADTASEEDFGLSVARLLHTPLFSGLAAIGGVVVTALLPLSVVAASPTPPSSAAATPMAIVTAAPTVAGATATATAVAPSPAAPPAAATSQPRPTLEQIFDLDGYPSGLLIAAIFGLTPNLLLGRLSQPIEQYKKDLRSTETQQAK